MAVKSRGLKGLPAFKPTGTNPNPAVFPKGEGNCGGKSGVNSNRGAASGAEGPQAVGMARLQRQCCFVKSFCVKSPRGICQAWISNAVPPAFESAARAVFTPGPADGGGKWARAPAVARGLFLP